jgi:hypothetical protein
MTDHQISILFLGINLGVMLMILLNIVFDQFDNRRDRRAAAAALAQRQKRDATSDWRDALTAREPA